MAIGVHGDPHIGVTQTIRHYPRVDASQEHEGGVDVAEVVKAEVA